MKKIYFLFAILFAKNFFAQEILTDPWQNILAVNLPQTGINYKTSTIVNNKIIMIVDTLPLGVTNLSGLYTYDINTRTLGNIPFTLDIGDRGIRCATSYKTGTPGLEYGIFGCFSHSDVGASYPVVYTYNGQTNTIIADSIEFGTKLMHEEGIKNIAMFSPGTNNDTMRVFSVYNNTICVFSKQINQTSFIPGGYSTVNIDYINGSFVHNNKLYLAGMYQDLPCLLESTDGRTFTNFSFFNPALFPQYSCVNNVTFFNNQIYYSISLPASDYNIYRYDNATNHILVQSTTLSSQRIKTFAVYKNRLWYSTAKNDVMSVTSHITSIDAGGNIYTSATDFGFQDVDGDYMELVTNIDSLYFIGTKGTFQASKSSIVGNSSSMSLINKYIGIAKLNPPVASFNYNNNQICLNANETFTSTSQNADSLHWLYNGAYYASSPGGSAWMNINFPSTGNHSVGLVAFGGTLTDSTFLSVNVYSLSASVTGPSNLCYGDSLHLTSNVSNGIGTVNYNWYNNAVSFGSNNPNINLLSTIGISNYYLVATDIHGCSALSNTVATNCNLLTNMVGTITSASVGIAGNLTLYKYEPVLTKFDSVTTIPIGGFGSYTFTNLLAGDYILKAIPSASSLQTTYYGTSAISWKDATPITHGCISPSTIDIEVDSLVNIGTGPGVLTGSIYQGNGFGQRTSNESKPMIPGTPIGGIIVKGGKNPGGQMFVQTITAADGTYTLSGIPINTGDDYFILVDIPGLDTNGTYHRVLTSGTPQINGLDFNIDSIYVNPIGIGMITAVSTENSVFENKITLFPNPAKELAFIEYELTESANVQIELYDLIGQKIKTIQTNSKKDKSKHKHTVDLADLSSGVYFVKVKINNSENVIKLIITN